MSTHTAGPMEAARAAWVRIGRAKPNGDIEIFRKADAEMRLIAAAPELLAALQAAFDARGCERGLHDGTAIVTASWLDQARAAISKATGEQSC